MSTWVGQNHDVRALINYFPHDSISKEIDPVAVPLPARFGDPLPSSRYMTVVNARGREQTFDLDKNGFEFVTLPCVERDVSTDGAIEETFYPEVQAIIKKRTGASHVFPLGHLLRKTTNEILQEKIDTERYNRFATAFPHCDCPVAYPERLQQIKEIVMQSRKMLKNGSYEEARRLDSRASRWAIVQIWKPLKTVERDALAVCDALSYEHSDWRLRTCPNPKTGYSVLSHPLGEERHKWVYLHNMTKEEMIIFKGCDSMQDVAGFTGYAGAHTAIVLPKSGDKEPRESIEARFLCFWA